MRLLASDAHKSCAAHAAFQRLRMSASIFEVFGRLTYAIFLTLKQLEFTPRQKVPSMLTIADTTSLLQSPK